jgi:ribosome maturation factor RimP
MADLWQVVDNATRELGFELIDLERTPGGLTRVFIDIQGNGQLGQGSVGQEGAREERLVTIDDCELVSRQLVHFQRLEVSSPGMDRPLTKHAHYVRFSGSVVKLRLRQPLEGRRNFEGVLQVNARGDLSLEYEGKSGEMMQLGFQSEDVERARLVPEIPFGRSKNES